MGLEDLFYYSETSPTGLRRKTDWTCGPHRSTVRARVGDVTGTIDNTGYYRVYVGKGLIVAHAVVWYLHYGPVPEGFCLDHKDGNRTNNNISNLRLATPGQNARNQTISKCNKTGYTGVTEYIRDNRHRFDATCKSLDGRQLSKSFSVNKYGYEAAKQMAIEHRAKMIAELNAQGACYTERHGKPKEEANVNAPLS